MSRFCGIEMNCIMAVVACFCLNPCLVLFVMLDFDLHEQIV